MQFLNAAEVVLAESKVPLSGKAITAEALRRGLILPKGKTPVATMISALYVDAQKNPASRFARIAELGPNRARRGSVRWVLRK